MINKLIAKALYYLPKQLIWIFSKKYIAGEHIEDALLICRELNRKGYMVTVDLLGENITSIEKAAIYKRQYLDLIRRFTSSKINGNFSVKPTMFGLKLDPELCFTNLSEIVQLAAEFGSFIRIDMEDSSCTSDEIEIFRKLKTKFPESVGLVLQSYLKRTAADLENLTDLHNQGIPLNIRLCKGIYLENEKIAFQGYQEIRDHFVEDLDFMLRNGMYAAIATHDKYLLDKAEELIRRYKLTNNQYEFQMLYGVTPHQSQTILNRNHPMRIYVPYGIDWLNYSLRRLNENPDIVGHILKAILNKR